jgi:hypothetical protein
MTADELEEVADAFCCGAVIMLKGGYENQFGLNRCFELDGKLYEVTATKQLEYNGEKYVPTFVFKKLEIKEITL